MSATLSFFGGVDSVTGANFLLEVKNGGKTLKILVDCGLFQGKKFAADDNRPSFAYDPASVDFLFVTHAHADHIGRIPKLVKEGFSGVIYSTPATKSLSEVMYEDAVKIIEREAREKKEDPLYVREDVVKALSLWKTFEYHEPIDLPEDVRVTAKDAGHILGSAMFEFERTGRRIVFTGDLGNSPSPLMKDTEKLSGAHYLVMESVYGDKNHEDKHLRVEKLRAAVKKTVEKKGVLVIPAFSLERTQVILYELNNLVEEGKVPKIPVFLDSPLAIKVTEIYKQMKGHFNSGVLEEIKAGDDIFNFPKLHFMPTANDSKRIDLSSNPKIIIAGGGMSEGGRVVSHEKNYLPDPKNTILLVGYQSLGTLGRTLKDGEREVTIDHVKIPVRAEILSIDGYSSHKDSEHLLEFVESTAETLEKVFVVMGEPKASMFLSQRIHDYLGVKAICPVRGSSAEINF